MTHREHSRPDIITAPAACALCHAAADLVHEPPCERHDGGMVCRATTDCRRRLERRRRQLKAAWWQTHGEIGGEG